MVTKSKKSGKKTSRKPAKKTKRTVKKKVVKRKVAKPKKKTIRKKAVKKVKPKKTVKKKATKKKSAKKKVKLSKKLPVVSQAAVTKKDKARKITNVLAERYYKQYKNALEEVYNYFEQEMEARQNGDLQRTKNLKEAGYRAQERADEAYGKFLKAKARET